MIESIGFIPFSHEEFARFYQDFTPEYANIMMSANMFQNQQEAIDTAATQMQAFFPEGLETKGQHLFKLKNTSQDVGILWYSETEATHKHTNTAWFCYIYVDPAFRRKGYAKAAITKMEAHLKSIGIKRIGLNIFFHNSSAKKLYESLGYLVVKTFLVPDSAETLRYELSKTL